jgi:hypothetical protein
MALEIAVTAQTFGSLPSSLLGMQPGSLAALRVDRLLAGRLRAVQVSAEDPELPDDVEPTPAPDDPGAFNDVAFPDLEEV